MSSGKKEYVPSICRTCSKNADCRFKADSEGVEQLRADMEGLLTEINELSRRNDELMNAKESDNALIRDLDNQMKEYKRKYEQAKTELRSVKGKFSLNFQLVQINSCTIDSDLTTFPPSTQDGQDRGPITRIGRWWNTRYPRYGILVCY